MIAPPKFQVGDEVVCYHGQARITAVYPSTVDGKSHKYSVEWAIGKPDRAVYYEQIFDLIAPAAVDSQMLG